MKIKNVILCVLFGLSATFAFGANNQRVYPSCIRVFSGQLVAPPRADIPTIPLAKINGTPHAVHPLMVARPEIIARLPESFPVDDRADVVNVAAPTPELYAQAYDLGVFPWREVFPGEVTWHSPEKRGILFFNELKIGTNLRKFLMDNVEKYNSKYVLSVDKAFDEVVTEIAAMNRDGRPGQSQAWFHTAIADAYRKMHTLGYTHTVEVWDRETGELVGGILGTAANGYFAGESMFHRKEIVNGEVVREVGEVAKMAALGMILVLQQSGFKWIDTQTIKPGTFQHQSNARYVSRDEFLSMVSQGQGQSLSFKIPTDFFTIYFDKITPEEAAEMKQPHMSGQPNVKKPLMIEVADNEAKH